MSIYNLHTDGYKYWHQAEVAKTTTHTYWTPPHQSNAADTEITSYVLLTYAEKYDFTGVLNIMKWMTSQRLPHGGFSSTQDTVLALQALSQFAKMAYAKNFDIQVHLKAGSFSHSFSINQRNALVLQKVELPSIPSNVQVTATGHGIALVDVAVFFHADAEVEAPSFEMTVELLEETINSLSVKTCVR
ncbi:alpha-2-macroglobulin-like [Gigantopelta aegis]|uniref:alpha-2-macroglobulin-like n=1 Tax=Gigantopelta aegis TaxID=1735272 RepID=UPI001B888E96|nr:alpha-2-macroglobulin-like [Gigantopelta aegis]